MHFRPQPHRLLSGRTLAAALLFTAWRICGDLSTATFVSGQNMALRDFLALAVSPIGQWVVLALAIGVLFWAMIPGSHAFGASLKRRSYDLQELAEDAHCLLREFKTRSASFGDHYTTQHPFGRSGMPYFKDLYKDPPEQEPYRLSILWLNHLDDHVERIAAVLNSKGLHAWLLRLSVKWLGGFELIAVARDASVGRDVCLRILQEHENKLRSLV